MDVEAKLSNVFYDICKDIEEKGSFEIDNNIHYINRQDYKLAEKLVDLVLETLKQEKLNMQEYIIS